MARVSIVIPTYNRASYLRDTVESVLAQEFEDHEVIVVDDCSTDATRSVVDSFDDPRIRYIRHDTNRGGSAARNTGMRAATGEYVAFLDDDDRWHPEKLSRQVACLDDRGEDWVAVYCDYTVDDDEWTPVDLLPDTLVEFLADRERAAAPEGGRELIPEVLTRAFPLGGASTLMLRTDVARALGGFDESFPRHQDWEFLIRVLKRGKIAYVDEVLVTKADTDRPSSAAVAESKQLLLSEFDAEVRAAEAEGYDVTGTQRFDMVRCHFMNGEFVQGLKRLPGAKLDAVALARATLIGVHAIVTARADI